MNPKIKLASCAAEKTYPWIGVYQNMVVLFYEKNHGKRIDDSKGLQTSNYYRESFFDAFQGNVKLNAFGQLSAPEKEKPTYPWIGIFKSDHSFVVQFYKPDHGIVLATTDDDQSYWRVGDDHDDWDESCFEKFHGQLEY